MSARSRRSSCWSVVRQVGEDSVLSIPIILAGGLLLGWFASVLLKPRYYHRLVLHLVVGITGAAVSRHFFPPVLRYPSLVSGHFSGGPVLIGLAGSALLLATVGLVRRSEVHTSALPSLLTISYAVFCLKKK